jgi:hypothetical protein
LVTRCEKIDKKKGNFMSKVAYFKKRHFGYQTLDRLYLRMDGKKHRILGES